MVGRAIPLLVDVLVTALAGIRLHEELARNFLSTIHLCGTGEKWAGGTVAFAVHGEGRQGWIFNASMLGPASFAEIASHGREYRQHNKDGCNSKNSMTGCQQSGRADQACTEKAQAEVDVDERPLGTQRSGVNQRQPWDCAEEQESHSDANQRLTLTPRAHEPEKQPN